MTWAEQYRAGATIEQIALDAGVNEKAVRARLRADAVPMRRPGERAGVERRPGPRDGDIRAPREPVARIVRPSVQRMYR